MEYKESALCYEDYCRLRESVGWEVFCEEQTKKALSNTLHAVTFINDGKTIGMGRVIGDGMYFTIVDIVVHPDYQKQGIGKKIMKMLLEFIDKETPIGGRYSIQLIAEKGKEEFYEKLGFKKIPHEHCGSGMRKIIHK